MNQPTGTTRLPWWCVLPDDDAAGPLARRLAAEPGGRVLPHASGRPWLIGGGWGQRLRTVTAGPLTAAVVGDCLVGTARLRQVAHRAAETGDQEPLMRLPGSYALLVSCPRTTTAAGDVAGLHRLFTTRVGTVPVVSNRPRLLAHLLGAGTDERWLLLHLLAPQPPAPLLWQHGLYERVCPLPPGHQAHFGVTGLTVRRYWTPPTAELSLEQGAARLREALAEAVDARVAVPPHASVQLSGGLDSQALAALAARSRPASTTLLITVGSSTSDNPDARWAARAADMLPGADHHVLGPERYPRIFQDLTTSQFDLDEPAPFAASAARLRHTLRVLAEHDSGAHLNGQGGDESLTAPLSYLAAAARRRPHLAWRHLRGHAALHHTSPLALARAAAAGPYDAWLRRAASRLTRPAGPAEELAGWQAPPRLAPWISDEAAHHLQALLYQTADQAQPLDDDITTHGALMRIRSVARRAGLYRDAMEAAGVPGHFPYLDRTVIEAALATRPDQRTDPWAPKPLLTAALAPLTPPGLLIRRDKGHYNAEIHTGLAAHGPELADLFTDSALAQAGLIDETALRSALAQAATARIPLGFFTETLALELYLRSTGPP
ncbi:hypothetical protein GCM10009801_09120 [Streptomyces albiaxialis]|uniref:asparagine synthase (glutamine-hydrolyzing) n=1 Tax=Streptomyces albiaxialis TaxID=329523 RepID=A0ABN2VLM1_9ACTN